MDSTVEFVFNFKSVLIQNFWKIKYSFFYYKIHKKFVTDFFESLELITIKLMKNLIPVSLQSMVFSTRTSEFFEKNMAIAQHVEKIIYYALVISAILN